MDSDPEAGDDQASGRACDGHEHRVIERLADVVVELADAGDIVSVSGEVDEHLGYEREELRGRRLPELVAADAKAPAVVRSTETFHEALADGEPPVNLDVPLETADGAVVSTTLSVLDHAGEYCCLLQNVGRYQPAEQQRERYVELVRSMDDPLCVLDEDGDLEWVNDALLERSGYERAELRGRSVDELLLQTGNDHTPLHRLDPTDVAGRASETFEAKLVTKDGRTVLTEANVTMVTDEEGNHAGAVGTLRDIRERKQRERDLELFKQVLTRVFRHNVRNELNIVQGHATILDDHVEDHLEEHTEAILDTSTQLLDHSNKARLLEQVIETDRLYETDLSPAIERLADSLRDTYPGATIEVDVPGDTEVEAHSHILSAVEELVENAIQHASTDTPWVRLWTDETDEFLTLFVEDAAGGLEDHEIAVLREGVESRLEHSSGVGLWLVRWIVESSNADMIAHRTDDGSLMGIRFPHNDRQRGREEPVGRSPVTRTPAHVREETTVRQLQNETVVGRIEELHRLEDVYDALEQSGGHAVLLTGESGIGKTTLVEQFRERLGEHDETPLIASGSCEAGVTPPYAAFREAMTDVPATSGLADVLDEMSAFDAEGPETVDSRRRALFADVADELRDLARERPVVIVLEDLQQASHGTIDLLAYLIDEVGQWALSVLFLGTCRSGDVDATHPAREIVEETAATGRGTVLELEPFDVADVRRLLADMLDVEELPDDFVTEVHEHTGGTPLAVTEIGRHLLDTLGPSPTPAELPDSLGALSVPATVETAVTERIEALDDPVTDVLELGAVIGTTVSFDVLREATEYRETTLLEAVDELVRRRIWTRTDGTLGFIHGVVREQTLHTVPDGRRDALHARVAAAIETVHDGELNRRYSQLASHYEKAGEYERAAECFGQAGDRAREAYAHEDAIGFYERAMILTRDHGVGDEGTIATLRADLAHSYRSLGAYDSAREHVEAGIRSVESATREECRLLGIKAGIESDQGQFERARETATRQREQATQLGARDHEARAIRQLGTLSRQRGEFEEAADHLLEGLAIARETGNEEATALIRKELGTIALRQSEYEQARTYYRRCLETARELSARQLESACLTNLGAVAYRQGEYEQASQYWRQARNLKRDIGDRRGVTKTLGNLGLLAERQGEYERATAYLEESLDTKRQLGDRQGEAHTLNTLGIVARKQGEYERATTYLDTCLDIARDIDATLCEAWAIDNAGQVALQQGDYERAREYFEETLTLGRELSNTEAEASGLCGLAAVARERGEYETAREYLTAAHDQHLDGGEPLQHAKIHLEWAYLELAVGAPDAAREHVENAHGKFADIDAVHWVGRCQRIRGGVAAASGSPAEARQHWEDALETFESLDTPQELLATLRCLVEQSKNEDDRKTWLSRAREVLRDAPEAVATQHEWVDAHDWS